MISTVGLIKRGLLTRELLFRIRGLQDPNLKMDMADRVCVARGD